MLLGAISACSRMLEQAVEILTIQALFTQLFIQ